MVKMVMVIVVMLLPIVLWAQGINLSGGQDTVRLSIFGPAVFSSVFTMNQSVQTFNDTASKYGYGRISSAALGTSVGYPVKLTSDIIGFLEIFGTVNLPGTGDKYSMWHWRAGLQYEFGYVALKNSVFRLYPMVGFLTYAQWLTIQERLSTTPAMLNPAQFQEPWRVTLFGIGSNYFVGLGADVLWEDILNRVYQMQPGEYRLDTRVGIHVSYNFNTIPLNTSPDARYWSANGALVQGLAAIAPQGLSLKVTFVQEMVKIK